jgi:TatD DNase family protein
MFSSPEGKLRIVLETDAPYMVPSNIYGALTSGSGKLPLSHSAMVPWTAEFVAEELNKALEARDGLEEKWDAGKVMRVARENAREMYGV